MTRVLARSHQNEAGVCGKQVASDAGRGFHRAVAANVIGAVLEWYEFAVYGALAGTVFSRQFFPESTPHTGVLLAFGTQAVGFLAPRFRSPAAKLE